MRKFHYICLVFININKKNCKHINFVGKCYKIYNFIFKTIKKLLNIVKKTRKKNAYLRLIISIKNYLKSNKLH